MYNINLANKGILINDMGNFSVGKNCEIHPTAIIEDGAVIGNNVFIGAYCVIGSNVVIGDNCEIKPHVVIEGNTTIGSGNTIYSFAVIGQNPQDLKYHGEPSKIKIGNNNKIREHTTIHPGTEGDNMITIVGDNNLLMVNTHIAHDCIIGNNCIFANNATLGGHVHVGDFAVLGGLSAVHQKVRIGQHAMVGGMTGVEFDVIPYGTVMGNRASLAGLNLVGMKRCNFSKDEINAVRAFYKDVFENQEGTLEDNLKKVSRKYTKSGVVKEIKSFIKEDSQRRLCTVRK